MSLNQHGINTFPNEVTNIEPFGFWILTGDTEYFVSFDVYPIFKKATIEQIFNMKCLSPTQLHWPDLDADIEIEALENPDKYSLIWRE